MLLMEKSSKLGKLQENNLKLKAKDFFLQGPRWTDVAKFPHRIMNFQTFTIWSESTVTFQKRIFTLNILVSGFQFSCENVKMIGRQKIGPLRVWKTIFFREKKFWKIISNCFRLVDPFSKTLENNLWSSRIRWSHYSWTVSWRVAKTSE